MGTIMIQDVKLGTQNRYTYAMNKCAFLLDFYLEIPQQSDPLLEYGCGKGCGYKNGSSGVAYEAYDDSYCDKF